jgi:hypothetical protein
MKYQLSYAEIEQLSENIFEKIPKKEVVVDRNCLEESWDLWNKLRDEPFRLLINCKNRHRFSYEGSRDLGKHSLLQKTAILCDDEDYESKRQLQLTLQIKKMSAHFWNHKVFTDREEAINWLTKPLSIDDLLIPQPEAF